MTEKRKRSSKDLQRPTKGSLGAILQKVLEAYIYINPQAADVSEIVKGIQGTLGPVLTASER